MHQQGQTLCVTIALEKPPPLIAANLKTKANPVATNPTTHKAATQTEAYTPKIRPNHAETMSLLKPTARRLSLGTFGPKINNRDRATASPTRSRLFYFIFLFVLAFKSAEKQAQRYRRFRTELLAERGTKVGKTWLVYFSVLRYLPFVARKQESILCIRADAALSVPELCAFFLFLPSSLRFFFIFPLSPLVRSQV